MTLGHGYFYESHFPGKVREKLRKYFTFTQSLRSRGRKLPLFGPSLYFYYHSYLVWRLTKGSLHPYSSDFSIVHSVGTQ